MKLDQILDNNSRFVSTAVAATEIKSETRARLAIVTCIDTRLTGFMHEALGLKRGDAIFIRVSGPVLTDRDQAALRSLAVAIFLNNVEEVLVIGHTDCRLVSDSMPLINRIQSLGISRDAFGSEDLRNWFGLIHNVEDNVKDVVRRVRASKVIPGKIMIHGLVIDSVTGQLKVVVRHSEEKVQEKAAPPPPPLRIEKPAVTKPVSEPVDALEAIVKKIRPTEVRVEPKKPFSPPPPKGPRKFDR